ncbi:hypothetical protein ABPG77_000180 [Micractinium sp. CCAP 211/92]
MKIALPLALCALAYAAAGATTLRPSPSPALRRPQQLHPPLPPPPPPRPRPPHPPPRPPPPRPRPPHPPPRPPQPLQSLAEAGWLLWVRHLHALTRFRSPPVGPGRTSIHKLLPATFWYGLLAKDDVAGSLRSIDAADIWANTLQAYDPLWLRPQRALLSDTLRLLRGQAAAAKLVPPAALSVLARATNRDFADPGWNVMVNVNPNNEFVPILSPAWAFDSATFTSETQQAKARMADPQAWATTLTLTAAQLVRNRRVDWSLYTLDGAASLSPPPGVLPTDPLAWPAQHLLDLTASDVGITTRYDLAPALASLTVQSKGFFYGVLRPGPAWWSAAWAGPFPNTTAAARKAAQQYFAAPSGDCVTTPWSVAAMYSPRLLAVLQPAAYADFKARWNNVTTGGQRRLDVLAWSVLKDDASTGSVALDDATSSITVTPAPGRWYRVAQVQTVVSPSVFLGSLQR